MFTDSTTKVDSEPLNGSNDDITNPYECDQTLNVSACTLNLSADNASGPAPQRKEKCRIQCALSSKEEKSSFISDCNPVIILKASDCIKMEMQKPRSSKVKFIAKCSYSRLKVVITSRKIDLKLPQTLISTSYSACQRDEVMY
ncbi:hypothetical protein Tco_0689535 [Tanacetum coccineum]